MVQVARCIGGAFWNGSYMMASESKRLIGSLTINIWNNLNNASPDNKLEYLAVCW